MTGKPEKDCAKRSQSVSGLFERSRFASCECPIYKQSSLFQNVLLFLRLIRLQLRSGPLRQMHRSQRSHPEQ